MEKIIVKLRSTHEKRCKKNLLLLFLIFVKIAVFGQTQTLNKVKADSLFHLANKNIKKGEFSVALQKIKKSLQLNMIENDNKAIGNCYSKIATIHYYQGDYDKALLFFKKSIPSFRKNNYLKGVTSSTNNLGAIYYYLGNYPKALDFYKKALLLQEQLGYKHQIAGTTKNIGGIYLELNDFKNAMKNFQLAKGVYEKVEDTKNLSQVLTAIGETYAKQKKYNESLPNFNRALELAKKSGDRKILLEVLFDIGKMNYEKNEFEKALHYFNQTFSISKEIESLVYQSNSLIALGEVNFKFKKINQTIKKCKKGYELARNLKILSNQKQACECLYIAYKSLDKTTLALQYFERMHLLKDSMHLKQASNKILNMKFEKEMLLDSIANVEKERKLQVAHKKEVQKQEKQRNILLISGVFILVIAGALWSRLNYTKKAKAILQVEKDRSEHLLHNILPEEVADELKEKGFVKAQDFDSASILFTDFKSFTATASKLTPQELVEEINACFKAFDGIIEHYGIEKIKTIGDAYMAAGGLPKPDANAVKKTILAALDMQEFIKKRKKTNHSNNKPAFDMRVGIHVGPIVAGIVGVKKFQYDVWGDTVNTASRMESNGVVEKVNISQSTYDIVKDEKELQFEYRGKINTKGKGELAMYFVFLKELRS